MLKENSESVWIGVYIFVPFFIFRVFFLIYEVGGKDGLMQSAWAGLAGLLIGIPLAWLMQGKLVIHKLIPIGIMLVLAISAYFWIG